MRPRCGTKIDEDYQENQGPTRSGRKIRLVLKSTVPQATHLWLSLESRSILYFNFILDVFCIGEKCAEYILTKDRI